MRPDEGWPSREADALAAAEAARDRALAEVALLREQLGVERLVSYMQQESLRTGNPEAAPRWDDDPIVIEHGWTEGRCRRCGEVLPPPESALAAARSRIADLEATAERVNTVLDSWEKCPESTLSWAATVFRNQLVQDTARDETGDPQ